MSPPRNPTLILALAAALLGPLAARADYASKTVVLNQSDALADGIAYGTVKIEAFDGVGDAGSGGLLPGQVRLTFTANSLPIYNTAGYAFGFETIGFNSDLNFDATQMLLTSHAFGLYQSPVQPAGFGSFKWGISTEPSTEVSMLISGLGTDATLGHFLIGSALDGGGVPPAGSVAFAGRLVKSTIPAAGETPDVTELHWVGGSSAQTSPGGNPGGPVKNPPPTGGGNVGETPEPASLLLGGTGLLGLLVGRSVRARRRQAAPVQ